MNVDQVIQNLIDKNAALSRKNEELPKLLEDRATAHRKYKILLAQTILMEKTDGMSVTLIKDIAKGNAEVANAKFEDDIADGLYKAHIESMRDIRTAIDTLRSFLSWQKEEYRQTKAQGYTP